MAKKTCFERAIFFSWYCSIGDCKYCYMSTQQKPGNGNNGKIARRTTESLLAELILCKKLGWKIGFVSGGHNAYKTEDFRELLKKMKAISGEKFWVNIGPLTRTELLEFKPYTEGVVGSIETINPEIHDFVCPSKPVAPFEKMFVEAKKLGLKRAMTIILGLGETLDDYGILSKFIRKHSITKIHFYGLNPQKGTIFEGSKPPTAGYQAEWIRKTRKEFPKMDIQCGIWLDRPGYVSVLLKAGADSISKFPALKRFGSKEAKMIETEAKKAGRKFMGTLTKMPSIDVDKEIKKLKFDDELKGMIKVKLEGYIRMMQR
ncbi:radical SAM protein [Candidatus Woesearchaeota archaeon CG10_big_fil_rev_8_21_14_0_10_44_13]|nr:MAG: radical SAM protein [Candidatus Woesearchaeota archaeon CG10_big_fil_rev_8_21_14_0_10_44_13]